MQVVVEYGRLGHVGSVIVSDELRISRHDSVVIRTPRGIEVARVLTVNPNASLPSTLAQHPVGHLLRVATEIDQADWQTAQAHAQFCLHASEREVGTLPILITDAETFLEPGLILHVLPWDLCDLDPWAARLSEIWGEPVRILNVSPATIGLKPTPKSSSGCGSGGCSTGGCSTGNCGTGSGCSTGNCSRGSVQSADELQAHFLALRRQMEADRPERFSLR